MEWTDDGTILTVRPHGETSAIVEVFTEGHGRHAGIVRGATSRKIAPVLQPGAQVSAVWKARLEEHLGAFTIEPVRSRAATAMASRLALAGLNAVTALLSFGLPEREAHPDLYRRSTALLDLLDQPDLWPLAYLRWEMGFLDEMGFGLDLSRCAATGATEGLTYVSPRTGRAVSAAGAGAYADRLLPLPPVLRGEGEAETAEIVEALRVTGHFLTEALAPSLGDKPVPEARARLIRAIARVA
ncbi:DNA repair protein RecO [Aestuariibius sp. 2305UL40-4]|uniref:DNA repair protein RecO n=1 Tax=Aestuariibius violaceus TaxID=3234132 RepID=UPI00345EE982